MPRVQVAAILALTALLTLACRAGAGVTSAASPPAMSASESPWRAIRNDAAVEHLRERLSGSEPGSAPIRFAEPPTIDSLPRNPPPPPLPDSVTAGLRRIAVGDLDGDGLPDLVGLENVWNADSVSTTVLTRRNIGGGRYAPAIRYPVPAYTNWLILADFDGHGGMDVAVASYRTYNIFENNGDGTLGQRIDGDLTGLPSELYAADVYREGHEDLIVPLDSRASFDIIHLGANGSFARTNLRAIEGGEQFQSSTGGTSVAVGDLDADGNPDIAFLYNSADCGDYFACSRLAIFYGRLDRTFENPRNYQAYAPESGVGISLTLQDLDGDGRLDVGVQVQSRYQGDRPPYPAWIRNAGSRRLDAPFVRHLSVSRTVDFSPIALTGARFRLGAPEDLLFSDQDSVSILRGRGDGTFGGLTYISRGVLARVADMNADGLSDIIVTQADTTEVWLADGTGGLRLSTVVTAGAFLAAANISGDYKNGPAESKRWHDWRGHKRALDLAVVMPNGHIGILPGDGNGGFEAPIDFGPTDGVAPTDGSPVPFQAVDLDGDGLADVALTRSAFRADGELAEDSLVVKWNLGNQFSAPSLYDLGSPRLCVNQFTCLPLWPFDLKVGDFNGDGRPDLAVVKHGEVGALTIVLNQGDRTFGTPSPLVYAGGEPTRAAIADYDGDGLDDIVVLAVEGGVPFGYFEVFRSSGDGSLQLMGNYSVLGTYPNSIAAGDFNGDGRPDLVVGCEVQHRSKTAVVVPNISPPLTAAHTHRAPISAMAETSVDVPSSPAFALETVRPNPLAGNRMTVEFALSSAAPAWIELVDVAGRRVAESEVGSLGPGRHVVNLAAGRHLAPGIYLVRLRQGGNVRATRVAVLN
jgi:hypothetical protein